MNTHKRKSARRPLLARGIAAVGGGAVLLAGVVVLMTRPGLPTLLRHTEPTETSSVSQPTESPIPTNPYGPEDFTYDGDYLTCSAGPSSLGVDVSSHQGQIDWSQVAGAGVEFAMVRVGYRGTTTGGFYYDDTADANLRGAKDAGLKVGAYVFSQATSAVEAADEAAKCITFLRDYEIDMPVVFDWEYVDSDARTADVDLETLMACTRTFCDAVADAGYEPMVYFNPHQAETLLELEELLDYPFWLAMYTDEMTYPHQVQMWQYTAKGSVPGISGNADLNLWLHD